MLPKTGPVILDYPIVVRSDTDRAAVDTAEQLTEFVASPGATAGFRSPNGRILNPAANAEPYEVLPTRQGSAKSRPPGTKQRQPRAKSRRGQWTSASFWASAASRLARAACSAAASCSSPACSRHQA